MRFFMERILPHINIALSAALLIVAVLHLFNPMRGFLNGKAAFVLIVAACAVSMTNAVSSCIISRENRKMLK